ncbi:unnamed protein product [Clonostachys solani]|uniref:Major facilitator superfamily (MFS) profile domain-containing protein n=1 Tax=Clonostachys solani TaxID=160281 RepID=A0A9N9ZM97_9HYPO|nr:unnamed protein product [Clonostachys solani]
MMSDSGQDEKTLPQADKNGTSQVAVPLEATEASEQALLRRLLRKTDLLVMPGLCLAYFTNTLDRSNLGNAKTDTIVEDLHLGANEFSLMLVVFYIPYALLNIPWSLLAKKFNPAVIIPLAVCLWGIVTIASVASKNGRHLMACRVLVGAIEASYKPCEVYYLSLFYTRKEMSFRVGMVGQFGFIAGAVSGLISWGVFQWNGSLRGWQYLFIIEGAITVVVAAWLFVWAPRSPQKCRFFSAEEKALAQARLELDSQDQDKYFRWDEAIEQLKMWQTWVFAFMALLYGIGVASSSNFLPTMVKRLTKNTVQANLYTVGPNLVASAVQLTITWLSDRYQQRAYFSCGSVVVSILGWILLGTLDLVKSPKAGYFLTYLVPCVTFIPSNLVPVWLSSNTPTTTGRAVSLGLNYTFMNLAGVLSSVSFRDNEAPVHQTALILAGATQAGFAVTALAMRYYYVQMNNKLDKGLIPYAPGMSRRPEYRYAV